MTTEYEILSRVGKTSRSTWDEGAAQRMAAERGLGVLSQAHWCVIYTLREHFVLYGALPPMRVACDVNRLEPHCVDKLFHSPEDAWRIAGLPDPGEEARSYLYPDDAVQH